MNTLIVGAFLLVITFCHAQIEGELGLKRFGSMIGNKDIFKLQTYEGGEWVQKKHNWYDAKRFCQSLG